jgi:hypothetical protein
MLIKNAELWYAKLNRPNARFNRDNPAWELQLRTYDKAQKKEWEEANLMVKAVVPDEGAPYFRVNLKKRTIKEDGTPSAKPDCIDADLQPLDPDTIGNGSIGNVRIFQYPYPKANGDKGTASVLMGVQVTKHIVYIPKPRDDDFEVQEGGTEVIVPPPEETEETGEA